MQNNPRVPLQQFNSIILHFGFDSCNVYSFIPVGATVLWKTASDVRIHEKGVMMVPGGPRVEFRSVPGILKRSMKFSFTQNFRNSIKKKILCILLSGAWKFP